MTTLFAPPELLSAYAYAVDGNDPDLPKGTHLRLFAGHGPAFPIAPFVVFKLKAVSAEPWGLHVTDRSGTPVPEGLNLSHVAVADVIPKLGDDDTRRTVRVDLEPGPDGGVDYAELFDQQGRSIARRRTSPWQFAAPVLHRLRLEGYAEDIRMTTRVVNLDDVTREEPLEAVAALGLPVDGDHPWYVAGQGRGPAIERVRGGAPKRPNPMDRPLGPFDPFVPKDADVEEARVESMLQATLLAGGLDSVLGTLVDETAAPPWLQKEHQKLPLVDARRRQSVTLPRAAMFQLAAMDPGLARYLGFATHIEDLPEPEDPGSWDTLAIVGVFAVARGDAPRAEEPDERRLFDTFANGLEDRTGRNARDQLLASIDAIKGRGHDVRTAVTVVAPVPPWDPPTLPRPEILDLRWQPPVAGAHSNRYRATFSFADRSLLTLAAVSANMGGGWTSRHERLAVAGAPPDGRAQPRIFGRERNPAARGRLLGRARIILEPASLLAEHDLTADAGEIHFRVQASDLFGRFGEEVEFSVQPPLRPPPPPPKPRHRFERADIDLTSTAALVPGAVKVAMDAGLIPRIDDLAAGSLPIAKLELAILGPITPEQKKAVADGKLQIEDLVAGKLAPAPALVGEQAILDIPAPDTREANLPLSPLKPQETGSWMLSATFYDQAGTPSKPVYAVVTVTDIRPPKTYHTAVGLYWTSTPGPSPDVELRLAWDAPEGSLHRVYLTDERGLGLRAAAIAGPHSGFGPSRAQVAAAGCQRVLDRLPVAREGFRLLTDPPIKADNNGRAVLSTTLPRTLSTVQFLRVVPLGPDGAEPPFEDCGIVPVAVPDSRRPLSPRLKGDVDHATGIAAFTVVADGFDRSVLQRDEPGLFGPGKPGNKPPSFRLRRAVGPVPDPIYARTPPTLPEEDLGLFSDDGTTAIFFKEVADDNGGAGLEPFVPYVYWAEVRLPPERRVPPGLPVSPPPGRRVVPVDDASAEDYKRPFSLPSAPCTLMRVPPGPPDPPRKEDITATRQPPVGGVSTVVIRIANPPRAHNKAIDCYRLAVWTQWQGRPIELVTNANGQELKGVWPSVEDGEVTISVPSPTDSTPDTQLTLKLALIDPLGRLSAIAVIDTP